MHDAAACPWRTVKHTHSPEIRCQQIYLEFVSLFLDLLSALGGVVPALTGPFPLTAPSTLVSQSTPLALSTWVGASRTEVCINDYFTLMVVCAAHRHGRVTSLSVYCAGSGDDNFYKLDPTTGTQVWKFAAQSTLLTHAHTEPHCGVCVRVCVCACVRVCACVLVCLCACVLVLCSHFLVKHAHAQSSSHGRQACVLCVLCVLCVCCVCVCALCVRVLYVCVLCVGVWVSLQFKMPVHSSPPQPCCR